MKIMDLSEAHKASFSICLEEWSEEAREAGNRRAQWVDRFLPRGLRAQLAVDDAGVVGGMIQHLPIEQSWVEGQGLRFMPCIWVHGHKQGRGNFQGKGMGSALLESAEADARAQGAQGMVAWGVWLPFWMRASWFKRHGYRKVDRQGMAVLLYKPFTAEARPPRWLPAACKQPELVPGKVTVTAFSNGWCTAGNMVTERAKRAALELGDKVVYREVDTSEPSAVREWGYQDALFINHRQVGWGPPLTYEKIRALIDKQVKRL